MSVQAYKIKALIKKDLKDIRRNSSAMMMALLCLFFTILYRFMNLGGEQMPVEFVLSIGVLMNISMLPIAVMAMFIAEEKEKNTLRTLMLSNVSAAEFLLSKAAVILLVAEGVNLLSYILTEGPYPFLIFLAVTVLTSVCMLFFGATVGVLCKNQMSTGVAASPLAMLMLIPAIFGQVDESIASVARFVPSYAMLQLLGGEGDQLFSVIVILAWTAAAAGLFSILYAKKRLDT